MLSCKEIVKIVSSEERRAWRQKLEVRLHLMMCHHCGKYAHQLALLKAGFKKLFLNKSQKIDEANLRNLEDRIIKKYFFSRK